MTHPTGSLPASFDGNDQNLPSTDDPHNSADILTESNSFSSSEKEVVDDYRIVPQDASLDQNSAIYTSGDLYSFLATSQETNFNFNAFDFFVPEGGGPPPHIHNYEHEAFFVEEGQVSFFLGNEAGAQDIPPEEKQEEFLLEGLPEGTFIFGPRLRPHGFANPDSDEAVSGTNNGARIFSLTTPGGLDLLFEFAGIPVEDRNQSIPLPPSGVDPKQLEFGQRTGGGIAFSGYEPPQGTPDYTLVLPENTPKELENNIRNQVAGIEGFSVFTNSERPTFTGAFGIEYTSLSNLAETEDALGTKLSYDQFSLAPQFTNPIIEDDLNGSQISEDFPDPIVSEDYKAFYVREGTLSFKINDEVKIAEPNTFVYVAPGNEYSIANFGTESVESLAMTIPVKPESERTIVSPLESQADTVYQSVFLGNEADVFFPPDESDRQVYGKNGNDQLLADQGDRLFGEEGDDILNASSNGSQNLLDGGLGNDELLGGKDSELVGGEGDDILRIGNGGNNLLYGNGGADQFWLANNAVPDTVVEDRQSTNLGLPVLTDTRNTIVDFESGVDRIGISGLPGVSSFEDLKLLPAFGDIRSTSIVAEVEGVEGEISLGNVTDVLFNELSADDFVFA
jgi:mannose-6-phosphate isomerase-like protein (cupin superfamily)